MTRSSMAATAGEPPRTRPSTARGRPGALGPIARRVLLAVHLALAVGWLGVTSTFVVLTFWLLHSRDPATLRTGYAIHELMVVWLARPAAIGAAVTGLLLVCTAGADRRPGWWSWWVPAKFVLVVATVMVTVGVSPAALRFGVDHADTVGTLAYSEAQYALVLVAIYHVVMITAAAMLAVFRPGARSRGASRHTAGAS